MSGAGTTRPCLPAALEKELASNAAERVALQKQLLEVGLNSWKKIKIKQSSWMIELNDEF